MNFMEEMKDYACTCILGTYVFIGDGCQSYHNFKHTQSNILQHIWLVGVPKPLS